MKRVVVTGLGPIAAIGHGKDEFFKNLFLKKNMAVKIPDAYEKNYEFTSKFYIPSPEVNLQDMGLPKLYEKLMGGSSKYSVAGSFLALKDAGYDLVEAERGFKFSGGDKCKTIIGIGVSNLEETFLSYRAHSTGEGRYNKFVIPTIMSNSASAWSSIVFNTYGENYTVNASCASGTIAIGKGFEEIRRGECEISIVGGVEYFNDVSGSTMRGFDALGVLTKSEDGNPNPFSENRTGFLYCDGAGAILVLEELEHAKKRNAKIYCEIVDFKSNSDAHSIVQIDESGTQIEKLIISLTKEKQIDYINSHGTGTILNDKVESEVLNRVFRNKKPYMNASKCIIGHPFAATGALEAAITAFSIKNGIIHGNILGKNVINNLNIPTETTKVDIEYAITLSYGFGGHNGGLLMRKYNG